VVRKCRFLRWLRTVTVADSGGKNPSETNVLAANGSANGPETGVTPVRALKVL
jgi:hypothetical protein